MAVLPDGKILAAGNFETHAADEFDHLLTDAAPFRNAQRFRDGTSGDKERIVRLECGHARFRRWFIQHDRHQRGCVDRDQTGNPSSS